MRVLNYRQTQMGWIGTPGVNRDRLPQHRGMQMKWLFQLGVPGDGQEKKFELEWHFYLYFSRLANSVPINPVCPESRHLTEHGIKQTDRLAYRVASNTQQNEKRQTEDANLIRKWEIANVHILSSLLNARIKLHWWNKAKEGFLR